MNREIETLQYADGCQGYFEKINGQYEGIWRIVYPNGQIKWEREMARDRPHGYCKQFNEDGSLAEEKHYFKGELDGWGRVFDSAGRLKTETLFEMGCPLRQKIYDANGNIIQDTEQKDSITYDAIKGLPCITEDYKIVKKYIKFDSDKREDAELVMSEFKRKAFRIHSEPLESNFSEPPKSFMGHINLGTEGEKWPSVDGSYLSPVLQLCIRDLKSPPEILKDLDYLMIFMHPEGYYDKESEDNIAIRAYEKGCNLVSLSTPEGVIDQPLGITFEEIDDYPSGTDDMPPGLRDCLELFYSEDNMPYSCESQSKIGGWPSWIQHSELFGLSSYQFVLQIDAYGQPYWDWGDCPQLYLFRHIVTGEFYATVQMS